MISINPSAQPLISSLSTLPGTTAAEPSKTSAMRAAGDVIKLTGATPPKSGEVPELRAPRGVADIKDTDNMGKTLGLAGVVAMLIGMLAQLMLQDSQRVSSSSARETQLALSGANAQRAAGRAEMNGAMASSALMMTSTVVGTARSVQGSNRQITSTRENLVKGDESARFTTLGPSPGVKADISQTASAQKSTHAVEMLKSQKLQSQGTAFREGGSALNKVAEGAQSLSVSGHRAEQAVAAGDAGVASRTTDAEVKSRNMTDELMNQIRSIRDRDIQSKNEVASHVAQGTR